MLSSRKLTRREFFVDFPLAIFAANFRDRLFTSPRKFELGERVILRRYCDDHLSANYGGIDWESGVIVGFCWQYDEWRVEEFTQGWSYFIKFDSTNNSDCFQNLFLNFEHETRLEKV